MKTIIVADIRSNVVNGRISGHIVPVARNYLEVLGSDFDVKIAAGPAILNSFDKNDCIVLPYNVNTDSLIGKIKSFINFVVLLWRSKGQIVIIQQSSTFTTFLAISLFYWWSCSLFLIQYNTEAINSSVKHLVYLLCKNKISGLLCPNDRVGLAYGRPYCVLSDYIKLHIPVLKTFNERKWDISIVGGITADKGVLEALQFLANKKYRVLVAGKILEKQLEPALMDLASKSSNIECRFGFVSDQDYKDYITDSKFCMLNYQGTYANRSSGAVLDNLFLGTPVIGHDCNAMNVVSENNVGFIYKNLHDLKLDQIVTEQLFDSYIMNIIRFYDRQKDYLCKLQSFIGLK